MAASYGSGLQSPPQIGRPVDRVFEEAQFTGEIFLNGRKLRDYPKICSKYDLCDTTHVDVSRNRLTEVPIEFCDYVNVERINCYHNVIRSFPDAISQLQILTHLNLSRNQLTVLTPAICMLGALEVLSASNNKLVSLPEEIGRLENLMDLDVSCNEISHLPMQIGDMTSLRCLNLRRNFLVELPVEISRLQLCRLDFSSNRIEKIPTVFRKMETLEQFILDHNPLSSPPAYICTKGRQHIMKFLHIEAIKEDRKRGIMINSDSEMKRYVRKSLPPQQSSEEMRNMLGAPESKWKRHTVLSNDSGYNSTGDMSERNGWQSGEPQPILEENNNSTHYSSQYTPSNNRTSQPYYKNPPYQHGNQQWQNHQQHPQQSYPHSGNVANTYRSSGSSGPFYPVSTFAAENVDEGSNYSDSINNERISPKPHLQFPQQHRGAHSYQQQEASQYHRPQQHSHHPYQENPSVLRHQPAVPSQQPKHHTLPSQHTQHPVSMSSNQQRAAAMSPPNISLNSRAMAPSPSHSTHSGHSNSVLNDVLHTTQLNRSGSPRVFYQPSHSRQGSNSSFSSDISSTSRNTHPSYQHQPHGLSVPLRDGPSSYLPPPPPGLTTHYGGPDQISRHSSSTSSYHLSPTRLETHDLPWVDDEDPPPPPPPPLPPPYSEEVAYPSPPHSSGRSGGHSSPPLTPPTPPMVITGNLEDEFTRELKRQKADYDRKKRQAEQVRVKQEEEEEREKEERRKAALKLQEEQRLLLERQEEQKRQEERLRRQQEEERERIQEEERKKREEEEAARKREEELQRLQEAVRIQAEEEKSKVIMRNPPKQLETKGPAEKNKISNNHSNNYINTSHRLHTHQLHSQQQQQQQQQNRPAQPPPPPPPSRLPQPPSSLPIHGSLAHPARNSASPSPSPSPSRLSHWQPQLQQPQQQNHRHHPPQQPHQKQGDYILTENDYRNSLNSQSMKEHQRLGSTSSSNGGSTTRAPQQYRRAASDGLRKPSSLAAQVDSLNYINRNGVASDAKPRSRQSSTSTTPSVSPGPSPRNSISHLAKPTSSIQSPGTGSSSTNKSPMGSQSHLAKPKSSVPRASAGNSGATTNGPSSSAAPAQSQAVRRTKAAADRSNASSPVTVRSARVAGVGGIARTQGSLNTPASSNLRQGSNSTITDDENKTKKSVSTPTSETSRLKSSRLVEPKHNTGLQPSGLRKTGQGDGVDNKRINTRPPTSTYGSGRGRVATNRAGGEESNFTMRRREEHQREEAEQMDRLRQTVESRLRVTLPDNLAEALRDGVVLCHLANQIRPRSVGSIHVPSPAVPKLTLAKCRRNVDNFLDACRKIGVDQEQICGPQDIFDEKGISRVALTVAALVAIGTNPKQSAV